MKIKNVSNSDDAFKPFRVELLFEKREEAILMYDMLGMAGTISREVAKSLAWSRDEQDNLCKFINTDLGDLYRELRELLKK